MPTALVLLVGIAYIALSVAFRFTPRARVLVGMVVGALLAGPVTDLITRWFGMAAAAVGEPLGGLIGQSPTAVAAALPMTTSFVLAVIVTVFLRRKSGGRGGGGGGRGGGGGGGGRAGGLATAALVSALLLPVLVVSVGDAVRGVTS